MTPVVAPAKAKGGCWTCKARKIRCDRALPSCQKCAQTCRQCEGYGLRLSWPRDNDKKRAITGPLAPGWAHQRRDGGLVFLNTVSGDVALYRHLTSRGARQLLRPVQTTPYLWRQPQSQVKHMDLVYHFRDAAHLSLVTFNTKTANLRDPLMRLALSYDSVSSRALFCALLSVASLHRTGLHEGTLQFKVAALNGLAVSAKQDNLSTSEAAQHVATCMLLAAFEIQQPSESSGEWLWYIQGALDIIQRTGLEALQSHISDLGSIIDWVYYHNSLSRFAMRHWSHESVAPGNKGSKDLSPAPIKYAALRDDGPLSTSPNPAHRVIDLLSEICATLVDPFDAKAQDEGYRARLKELEEKVRAIQVPAHAHSPDPDMTSAVGIYVTATLIYLARASQSPWEPPVNLDNLIKDAYDNPIKACSCEHFFPMFILACEARQDEQRAAVFDLVNRTQRAAHARDMQALKEQIEAIWVQQDLYADDEVLVNYLGLMNAAISSSSTLPSFV